MINSIIVSVSFLFYSIVTSITYGWRDCECFTANMIKMFTSFKTSFVINNMQYKIPIRRKRTSCFTYYSKIIPQVTLLQSLWQ